MGRRGNLLFTRRLRRIMRIFIEIPTVAPLPRNDIAGGRPIHSKTTLDNDRPRLSRGRMLLYSSQLLGTGVTMGLPSRSTRTVRPPE